MYWQGIYSISWERLFFPLPHEYPNEQNRNQIKSNKLCQYPAIIITYMSVACYTTSNLSIYMDHGRGVQVNLHFIADKSKILLWKMSKSFHIHYKYFHIIECKSVPDLHKCCFKFFIIKLTCYIGSPNTYYIL